MPAENDPFKEAQAYNYSIYLMVGMPYLLLGIVGFKVYRGLKAKARAEQESAGFSVLGHGQETMPQHAEPGGQGEHSCPDPSPVEGSLPAP